MQHGMNFRRDGRPSVFLMSQRDDATYDDEIADDGKAIIYEGHNIPAFRDGPPPASVDQMLKNENNTLTANGKFFEAAMEYKRSQKMHVVVVYEKIRKGLWVFNGMFLLVDAWAVKSGSRNVFKFRLQLHSEIFDGLNTVVELDLAHTRFIPSHVKKEVFKRDRGRCTQCGSQDNLHYDHELPFSRGGTSLNAKNIRLLCARHNLQKSDKIE